jgi:hypothetical protein
MDTGYTPPNEAHVRCFDQHGDVVFRADVDVVDGLAQVNDPIPAAAVRMEFNGSITGDAPFRLVDASGEPLRLPRPPS